MPQHNLVAYTLRVRRKREPTGFLRLGWLDGDDSPPRTLFDLLMKELSPGAEWKENEGTTNEVSGRVLELAQWQDEPTVYGRIRMGSIIERVGR